MQRDGKAFDQPMARGIRSKTVTAGFLPEDTILWDLQVESLAAKEKVVKIFVCKLHAHSSLTEIASVQKNTKGREDGRIQAGCEDEVTTLR